MDRSVNWTIQQRVHRRRVERNWIWWKKYECSWNSFGLSWSSFNQGINSIRIRFSPRQSNPDNFVLRIFSVPENSVLNNSVQDSSVLRQFSPKKFSPKFFSPKKFSPRKFSPTNSVLKIPISNSNQQIMISNYDQQITISNYKYTNYKDKNLPQANLT